MTALRASLAIALCIAAALLAPSASAAAGDVQTSSSTYRGGDLAKTVPIATRAWRKARSILSLSPKQVGALRIGRRIEVHADTELTICMKPNPLYTGTPCVGKMYSYNPDLKAKVVAAKRKRGTNGPTIAGPVSLKCSQKQPNRNRHCVLATRRWQGIKITQKNQPACAPRCYLNLVVSASSKKARRGQKVVVGSSDDSKRIHQGRSRLSSVLYADGKKPRKSFSRRKPLKRSLRVGPDDSSSDKQVAYSLPVRGLRKGDQIVVDAISRTKISHLPYNVTQRAELVFAKSRRSVKPDKSILETNPRLSVANGYGCTHGPSAHRSPCTALKGGILSVRKRSGKRWFINLVVTQEVSDAAPKASKWRSSHRVRMLKGLIRARIYRGQSVCKTCGAVGGTFTFGPGKELPQKPFKGLVRKLSSLGISSGSVECRNITNRTGNKMACEWHSEGRYNESRKYVCDSKAFLTAKRHWQVKICKDALGAQVWDILQRRDIAPTYAGGCKEQGIRFHCKWYAKGVWESGEKYFCKGGAIYNVPERSWNVDPCINERKVR